MKILVFSDSHGYTTDMEKVIGKVQKDMAKVLHLGDCTADAERMAKKFPMLSFEYVRGNCDFSSDVGSEFFFSAGGKKIFMTHGHNYGVKYDYQRIIYAAIEKTADVCLFGHTHLPAVFYESGITFMNPGSIARPRGAEFPSYGVIDVENSHVTANVVSMRSL